MYVDDYAGKAKYRTPLENPYARRVLEELGITTVGSPRLSGHTDALL